MSTNLLGLKVRDKITGFQGIATAYLEYLNGCKQCCVKPKVDKDGKYQDGVYIDIQQLEIVGEQEEFVIEKKDGGGDQADRPSDRYRG